MMKTCPVCGVEFKATRTSSKYCSRKCRDDARRVVSEATCDYCGKSFSRETWRLNQRDRHYCSWECFHADPAGRPGRQSMEPIKLNCVVCGTEFEVGGRNRPGKDKRFCSRECRWAGRYRQGKNANPLSDTQAAYIAGIVDGEGSVMIVTHHAAYAIKVSISNGDRPLLEWLVATTGIGGIVATRAATERTRATWIWHVNGEGAESLLKQIAPYMLVKAKQAAIALDFHGRLRIPALKADRTWQAEWRLRMQALNRRGPRAEPDE
jgi:hypothetical protein